MYSKFTLAQWAQFVLLLSAMGCGGTAFAAEMAVTYVGKLVCTKCHDLQGETFEETVHSKAFESLKPNVKAKEKQLAKLDPAKDYTKDKDCVGCHTTGHGKPGGYSSDLSPGLAKALRGVTCEACHGAGSKYRELHGDAENRLKRDAEYTDRKVLVEAGQNYEYEANCVTCHLNYEGSGYKGAHPPYTPYTPTLSEKYKFDYMRSVMESGDDGAKAIHKHFKLIGVFKGEAPAIREELQENAIDPSSY